MLDAVKIRDAKERGMPTLEDVVLAAIAHKYVHPDDGLREVFFYGFGSLAGRADFLLEEASVLRALGYHIPRETRYHVLVERCSVEAVCLDERLIEDLLQTEADGVLDAESAVRSCLDRRASARRTRGDTYSTPLTRAKRSFGVFSHGDKAV